MKENGEEIQWTLRRRRGAELGCESKVKVYISSMKKVKKELGKRLESVKSMNDKCKFSSLSDQDLHLSMVVRLLKQVREITISIFQSIFYFIYAPKTKQRPSKWLLVSKLMDKGKVTCEGEEEDKSDVETKDGALFALLTYISSKDSKMEMAQNSQKRLKELDLRIKGLGDGLECLFRSLIQTRVNLLNIFTH
ncbi:uncharacterized protein LOC143853871 [Tasmannia lanceolata]|uniref:uncharacterized protein LOC143853871 n=1 Tax=Tasmannia lanceolata TaxID=3420 RepID=UPI004062FEA0